MVPEGLAGRVPERLRPPQERAIEKGLFSGKNIVVSSPTASGKTLIAEMAGINNLQQSGGKMLYVCPLKALASEKFIRFSEKYPEFKVALSVGDYDSGDSWLGKYDIIIATSEKMDSLLRHRALWVAELGTIVFDEIHMIGEISRGPTLEMLITKLREMSDAQMICLSATIRNASEIAEWMGAELVVSDYRPIPLDEGVLLGNRIFFGNRQEAVGSAGEQGLLDDTLGKGKQILFFAGTRRLAEGLANRLVSRPTKESLELAEKVRNVLPVPTSQCVKLSEIVKKGIAFHHAGLLMRQRELLEGAFRRGVLKCICATPTLAMGVNLPAYRVVVRDMQRYSFGLRWIPVLDYKQMAGRAGRPEYDSTGEAICFAKTEQEKEDIFGNYINGEVEEVFSKLSAEPALRMHLLALIANRYVKDEESMVRFFSKTLWAKQFGDSGELSHKLNRVLGMLMVNSFVSGDFYATELGNRVSELYIDPLTAVHFMSCLKTPEKQEAFAYLQMLCNTIEMKPLIGVRANEYAEMQAAVGEMETMQKMEQWDDDFDSFIQSLKTAGMFEEWVNEASEKDIMEKYKVAPGELHRRLYNIDWLAYSAQEISRIIGSNAHMSALINLRARLKHGIKKELIPLVRFRGIGRLRARKLFSNGIKNVSDIRKAPIEKLAGILGRKTAESLVRQAKA